MTFKYLCFSFKGRLSRAWFWLYTSFAVLVHLFAAALAYLNEGLVFISIGVWFILIYADLAVCVKRTHDRNKSGWNLLFCLIPLIGGLYVFITCGCLKGTNGPNRYGPDPLEHKQDFRLQLLQYVVLIPNILWQFILDRVRELGKAMRGEK